MSLPRSISKIEPSTSFSKRSLTLPYFPKIICETIGSVSDCVPTIGKTLNDLSSISKVETILLVTLLNVAPTVIAFGFIPGLPIVLNSKNFNVQSFRRWGISTFSSNNQGN